jgi:hypothetical protein
VGAQRAPDTVYSAPGRLRIRRWQRADEARAPAGQGHREGCLCVICKQARRSGRLWAGMGAGGGAVWAPTGGGRRGGPQLRVGKRAFVRACPQVLGGPLQGPVRWPRAVGALCSLGTA